MLWKSPKLVIEYASETGGDALTKRSLLGNDVDTLPEDQVDVAQQSAQEMTLSTDEESRKFFDPKGILLLLPFLILLIVFSFSYFMLFSETHCLFPFVVS
jgi:hypothetical protein